MKFAPHARSGRRFSSVGRAALNPDGQAAKNMVFFIDSARIDRRAKGYAGTGHTVAERPQQRRGPFDCRSADLFFDLCTTKRHAIRGRETACSQRKRPCQRPRASSFYPCFCSARSACSCGLCRCPPAGCRSHAASSAWHSCLCLPPSPGSRSPFARSGSALFRCASPAYASVRTGYCCSRRTGIQPSPSQRSATTLLRSS